MLDFLRLINDLVYYWKYDSFLIEVIPVTLKAIFSFLFFFYFDYYIIGSGNNLLQIEKYVPNTLHSMVSDMLNNTNHITILALFKGCSFKIIFYIYEILLINSLLTSKVISFYLMFYWVNAITVLGMRRFYGSLFRYQLHKYIFKKS